MNARLYHLATRDDWDARGRTYVPGQFAAEGFIHLSTAAQIGGVAERFYRSHDRLVLVTIDPDRVTAPVRYENLEGGETLFPHLYGPLDEQAVIDSRLVRVDDRGRLLAESGGAIELDTGTDAPG